MLGDNPLLTEKQQKKAETVSSLNTLVQTRWLEAVNARSAVTHQMLLCRRAMRGEPLSGSHVDPDIPVTFNISSAIAKGISALIRDALAVAAESMFLCLPTDSPTLTEEAQQGIQDELRAMMEQAVQQGVELPTDGEMVEQAARMYKSAMLEAKEQAASGATALTALMKDRFQENGFRHALAQGIDDLTSSVGMVLKYPSMVSKKTKVWTNGRLEFRDELVRSCERIAPYDFYPAPNTTDVQTAEYIIERRTISAKQLKDLAFSEGYDRDEIIRCLTEHPDGSLLNGTGGEAGEVTYLREPDQTVSGTNSLRMKGFYDVQCYYGVVRGAQLKEFGVEVGDEAITYEAEVVVVGGCVIRAVLNPDPSGKRPFTFVCFDPVVGQLWGHSPVTRLFDIQRAITSTFVSMIGDLALAGAHIELDANRLSPDEEASRMQVRPRHVRLIKPDNTGGGRPAYNITQVHSNSAEFRATMDFLQDQAYRLIGIPRESFGQISGTIGRTSGGIAAMLNQSGKTLKIVLRAIEEQVIEPIVQAEVDYTLQWEPSADVTGDVNVQARGLTGVIAQDTKSEDLQWALQSLSALAGKNDETTGKPLIPTSAFAVLTYQLFKSKGIATEGIFPDYDLQNTLGVSESQAGGLPSAPKNDNMGGIALDGRSSAAASAIESSNNLASGL